VGNAVAEFAGIASGLEVYGISKYVSVPLGAAFVWWLVVFGTYKTVEKAFLVACLFYIAYPLSGILARPDWGEAARGTLVPRLDLDLAGVSMAVGVVGTTIAPWMQFYLQSAVVEKEVEVSQYGKLRLDVVIGSIMATAVAFFIVVACAATLHRGGVTGIGSAAEAAQALAPLAGEYARGLFVFGLVNASLFAASILPLATAYSVCEGLGLEAGVNKRFGEAPEFYWLYTAIIGLGAGTVLVPGVPLLKIILLSQILNGILLPVVLFFMVVLVNREEIMGRFRNGAFYNVATWATIVVLVALSLTLVITSFLPGA
jgi:Mn2+/Fe2+ NRAMP family transporter